MRFHDSQKQNKDQGDVKIISTFILAPHYQIKICIFFSILFMKCCLVFQYASKELECLKEAMEDLSKLQGDLAEFFCEDSKSFKMEECFKAFHQFINNFKKAMIDNDKRKEQEKSAEQRRQQRETEQAKRRSGSFQGERRVVEGGVRDWKIKLMVFSCGLEWYTCSILVIHTTRPDHHHKYRASNNQRDKTVRIFK